MLVDNQHVKISSEVLIYLMLQGIQMQNSFLSVV